MAAPEETERDTLRIQLAGMEEFAVKKMEERDAAEQKLSAIREAAKALLDALDSSTEPCGECGCNAIATRYLGWELDGESLCDAHAAEQLASDDLPPVEDHDFPVAAPIRALRALLEVKP